MGCFLRWDKKEKGIYLQVYESCRGKILKQSRNRKVKAFGYVNELISDDISAPAVCFRDAVRRMNEDRKMTSDDKTGPGLLNHVMKKCRPFSYHFSYS